MRCDGTCDLNWKNETRPKKEATNCQNFKLPCWSLALNTEACVIKKELDRIEQVAELFLEKPGWHLKLKIIPLGAFWSFFFVFAFSSFGFVSMLNITVSVTRSFYSKKNPSFEPSAKIRLEGLGSKALEDGSIHGREGSSDCRIQSHAAE